MSRPVNITIVTYNRLELTQRCVESLLNLTQGEFLANIVDNASRDDTWAYLQEVSRNDNRVRVHRLNRNMGVQVGSNYGWALHNDLDFVKLDNDIEILAPDWLEIMRDYAESSPNPGFIAYQIGEAPLAEAITLPDGKPFLSHIMNGGACAYIPASAHQRIGFWNEDYGKYGFEDVDFCRRCAIAGLLCGYLPHSGKIRQLGSSEPDPDYEQEKCNVLAADSPGKKTFIYNQMLFSNRIRDINVPRKMLPIPGTDPVRFKFNPDYKAILMILQKMLETIGCKVDSEKISLNFGKWKRG